MTKMVFNEWKPVAAMLGVYFAFAVVNVAMKKVLTEGMSNLLIVTYRQSISLIFLVPIAYFRERKYWKNITAVILCGLFCNALVGVTLTQYVFLTGLKYTSATYSAAFSNMIPVFTFVLALLLRQEKLDMKKKSGRVKVLGTLICVGGALVLILYKGRIVLNAPKSPPILLEKAKNGRINWASIIGSTFPPIGNFLWASWFVMQARIGNMYPYQYSSTAMFSFFSAIQSGILCLVIDRHISWALKGSIQISSLIFAGIVGSGLGYVGMSWCVKERGPVFTSAFSPLIQVFVIIFDASLLHEQIGLGSILGSILVVIGMYTLLWGKGNEIDLHKNVPPANQEKDGDCDRTLPVTAPTAVSPTNSVPVTTPTAVSSTNSA
nr:WAT1-related protein At3g30340-like [Coffea arabica]